MSFSHAYIYMKIRLGDGNDTDRQWSPLSLHILLFTVVYRLSHVCS